MARTRNGASYDVNATDLGRAGREKQKLERKRKAVQNGELKMTRKTEKSVETPPWLKKKKAEVELDRQRKKKAEEEQSKITRSSGISPRCTDFGQYRHAQYKGFFFCGNCDIWDTEVERKNLNENGREHRCLAGHESFIFPTTRTKGPYLPSRLVFSDPFSAAEEAKKEQSLEKSECSSCTSTEEEEDVPHVFSPPAMTQRYLADEFSPETDFFVHTAETPEESTPHTPSVPNSESLAEITFLKSEVKRLESELTKEKEGKEVLAPPKKAPEKEKRLTKGETDALLESEIDKAINGVFNNHRFRHLGIKRVTKALTNVLWNLNDGFLQEGMILKVTYWLRDNVFTPGKVLRAMDLRGGVLNYEGIEILRELETKGRKNYRHSILPSSDRLKRFQRKMNELGQEGEIVPFVEVPTEDGEGFEFDNKKALQLVFEGYELTDIAKERSVNMAVSCDGTNVSKKIKTVVSGFKINHYEAICPIRKRPLFCHGNSQSSFLQSRNQCYPTSVYEGGENKNSFLRHGRNFKFYTSLEKPAGCGNPIPEWKPLTVSVELDMKGSWEGTLKGGPTKIQTIPCQQCCTKSDNLLKPNPELCRRWCRGLHQDKENWLCYHHDMIKPEMIEKMKEEVEKMTECISGTIDEIISKTKMKFEHPDVVEEETSKTNPRSIHFIPTTMSERQKFSSLLTKELDLRGILTIGEDLSTRRDRLRVALQKEFELRNMRTKLEHATPDENALFLVLQSIPCILHCENRVNLKILTLILREGLSNAKKGKILSTFKGEGRRIDEFLLAVQDIVNKQILGTPLSPSQWKVPTNEPTSKLETHVATITMVNDKSVKVINLLEPLIRFCVTPGLDDNNIDRRATWLRSMPYYRSAMTKLKSHDDFSDEDIEAFQSDIDNWFQDYIKLHGKNGITNYIHMLSAGHFSDYLFEWRNLYRHSQQGWEALNNLMKSFWFRRTGRGGATNRGNGKKSKLNAMAKWLQRRMMWVGGYDDDKVLSEWKHLKERQKREQAEEEIITAGVTI